MQLRKDGSLHIDHLFQAGRTREQTLFDRRKQSLSIVKLRALIGRIGPNSRNLWFDEHVADYRRRGFGTIKDAWEIRNETPGLTTHYYFTILPSQTSCAGFMVA